MSKGGGGSQKSTGTQTVINEPAKFVKPFYEQIARESSKMYSQGGAKYFPDSTVVPFSDETEQALTMQRDRAMGGSALSDAAKAQQEATIRGDYLTGSPALEQELNRIGGKVNSQFAAGGGYRGSANQEILAREMSDAAVRNYAGERTLQQQAAMAAPSLAASDYTDIEALGKVGAAREDLAGRNLQDEMNRFNYTENKQQIALDDYIKRITGVGAGYGTQNQSGTQPSVGGSPVSGAISGASAGAGIAGALALSNPWSIGLTAGGALLGGLFR